MGEIWERAVDMALDGNTDTESTRILTLDGAVKCVQGRLPPPSLLEKFHNLQHLSIANIGLASLEQFPRLQNLQKLILSDNRIAGGLEFLVEAGLDSLRDLDLSNNRIQYIEDLAPLAQLRLVSLDLYECPVTRVKDYRSRVFELIKSLRYLDKMDAEGVERPESDDEEEEEEDEEEDDPGSGEIDGEDRPYNNGHAVGCEGIVDVDEDEESDADEEETESSRRANGSHGQVNGFHVAQAVAVEDVDDEEGEDEEDDDSGEEIDEEDGDEDVVEVHDIDDSDDDDDGVEDEDDDDDEDEDEEEVDNEERDLAEPLSRRRLVSTEGEIDGHEQGEEDGEEDDNGETGEEEQGIEDDGEFEDDEVEEEEDCGAGYLVQPVGQVAGGTDPRNEEEDSDEEEVEDVQMQPSSSSHIKRKRDVDEDEDEDDSDEDDDDDDGGGDEDDIVQYTMSSKKQR